MRHETCLNCLNPQPSIAKLLPGIVVAEAVSPYMHHHHRILCLNCGSTWFDDAYDRPDLRKIEVDLRDSRWCACPDDAEFYQRVITLVTGRDEDCSCDQEFMTTQPMVHMN